MPRFTSSVAVKKIDDKEKDVKDNYDAIKNLIANGTSKKDLVGVRATIPKNDRNLVSQNVGAARLHLMTEAREFLLGDGQLGTSKSTITCHFSKVKYPLKDLEVDHFHPAKQITTFLDNVDNVLKTNSKDALAFVDRLKRQYPDPPVKGDLTWKLFLKSVPSESKDEMGDHYKLRNTYRVLQYNNSQNLWFVLGTTNGSWGNSLKIPEDGQDFEKSIIGGCKIYGGDFLSTLGKIDSTTRKFFGTKIIRTGPIHVASISIDPETRKVSDTEVVCGLGVLARNWFAYQYRCLNTPEKAIAPFRDIVSGFGTNLASKFSDLEKACKSETISGEEAKRLRIQAKGELEAQIKDAQERLKAMGM